MVSTVPSDGKTRVDRDKNVMVEFSEAMNPSSINDNSFELVWFDSDCTWLCSDGHKVPAAVSYNADTHTAVLDPTDRLARRKVYYAVVWA